MKNKQNIFNEAKKYLTKLKIISLVHFWILYYKDADNELAPLNGKNHNA